MTIEAQIKQLVATAKKEASSIQNFSIGELAMTITHQLEKGTAIRITQKGVRVTHSRYIDKLSSATDIDNAVASSCFNQSCH